MVHTCFAPTFPSPTLAQKTRKDGAPSSPVLKGWASPHLESFRPERAECTLYGT
jgi:hypothetical protein